MKIANVVVRKVEMHRKGGEHSHFALGDGTEG